MNNKNNKVDDFRNNFETDFLKQHPEFKDMDEEEIMAAMDGYLLKRTDQKESKLKEHLEMFSDAIIAVAITMMVLEIPIPEKNNLYYSFIKNIGIFFISFFIVAEFWLNHHRILSDTKKVTERIMVIDFLFLAFLCLIPLFTKWIMTEPTSFVVVNFGIVMIVCNLLLQLINHLIIVKETKEQKRKSDLFQRMSLFRLFSTLISNVIILVFAYFQPHIGHWLFAFIPIVSFASAMFDNRTENIFTTFRQIHKLNKHENKQP